MRGNRWKGTLAGAATLAAAAAVAVAAAGDLDTTFGGDGLVVTGTDASGALPPAYLAVAVQPDGKVVGVGAAFSAWQTPNRQRWGIHRFHADGSPDTSFGTGGVVQVFGEHANNFDIAGDVAVGSDGRIYVSGLVSHIVKQTKKATTWGTRMGVVRLNANGTFDTTFGDGGKALIDLSPGVGQWEVKVALQSDGKVVLAGNQQGDWGIARLTSSGQPDTSFGDGSGRLIYAPSSGSDGVADMAIDAWGRIVVAGQAGDVPRKATYPPYAVARFTANGQLDATFGVVNVTNSIKDTTPGLQAIRDLRVNADGSVLLGGYGSSTAGTWDAVVMKFRSNGQLETGFGASGVARSGIPTAGCNGLAVQGDGKVLMSAIRTISGSPSHTVAALVRFGAGGALDSGFGAGGVAWGPMDEFRPSVGRSLAVGPDGTIVLAGNGHLTSDTAPYWSAALVRFLGD